MAQQTPQQRLFDLLVTKNFDPETLDVMGKPAPDPAEAEIFSFDYISSTGKNYGTVVIMFGDDKDLQMYFGDNVGRGMEHEDKTQWFAFLGQIKEFANTNLMDFKPKDLNRLKYTMQSMAAVTESIFENWTGTKTTSWNGRPTEARLMIRHKRPLGETDARFRYVESLFIETTEGERYKLPFTKLSGGRAMVEHIRQGGKVWDARGQHITEMVNELNVLSRFRRASHGKIFENDTKDLVEQTNAYYETAQKTLKSMSHSRGYTTYFESWKPLEITEEEIMIEGLKHLFVTQSLDSRIEDALPLLAKIQQQGNAMKEANIFEAWVNNLAEGTWAIPDTPEKQKQLVELMSKEFPVGADATNATEQLYDLLGDDELFDQLETLAEKDADADCRQVVYDRMQMLSDDPSIQEVINAIQIEPEATMNPAEPTDAGMSADSDDAQIPTNEEYESNPVESAVLNRIMMQHPTLLKKHGPAAVMDAVRDLADWVGDIDEIGTSDVSGWVKQVAQDLEHDYNNRVNTSDYETEIKETDLEDVECIGGDATDGLIKDIETDQDDQDYQSAPVAKSVAEEVTKSALQGQYGHSGKLAPVAKNTDFLTRLKELSGMIRN